MYTCTSNRVRIYDGASALAGFETQEIGIGDSTFRPRPATRDPQNDKDAWWIHALRYEG
jgi:hypothetical protein